MGVIINKTDTIHTALNLKASFCTRKGCQRPGNYAKLYAQQPPGRDRRQGILQIMLAQHQKLQLTQYLARLQHHRRRSQRAIHHIADGIAGAGMIKQAVANIDANLTADIWAIEAGHHLIRLGRISLKDRHNLRQRGIVIGVIEFNIGNDANFGVELNQRTI